MSVPPTSRPTPTGILVPLYGRRLHLRADGEGEATVVLDGADGAGTLAWCAVARELATFVRVVRYDRAGYGRSDPAPGALTTDDAAQDLRAALDGAGVPGPFLLVGHAYGGAVARHFARRYRREVVGLVLVDAPPEGFARLAPRSWRRRERTRRVRLAVDATLARLASVLPWVGSTSRGQVEAPGDAAPAPPPGARARAVAARLGEIASVHDDASTPAGAPLGDLPLVVIRHDDPERFAGLPAEDAARAEATWLRLQAELAATSRHGRLWAAEGSADDAFPRDPALVVRAVREILAQRAPAPAPSPDPGPTGASAGGASSDGPGAPDARARSTHGEERAEVRTRAGAERRESLHDVALR